MYESMPIGSIDHRDTDAATDTFFDGVHAPREFTR